MKNKNNIEDIFKNAFQDAEETPSQKVWNNLNKKLFVKNFAQKFVNFSVKPSEKVWIAINRQLLWKQFLHFSFTKFNVYYASIIGIITIFGIFYLNNNTSNNNSEIKYLNSKNIINNNWCHNWHNIYTMAYLSTSSYSIGILYKTQNR